MEVLGATFEFAGYVYARLTAAFVVHETLPDRTPAVPDLQSAWVLLPYCAAVRLNYVLRSVRPKLTEPFVERHGNAVWCCLSRIL